MKKTLFVLAAFAAVLSSCGTKVKLEPVAAPSWYTNETYFIEKNGMYFEMPVDTASIVMVGDDYIDRGDWAAFYGDAALKNRGITYNATDHVLYLIDSIARYQPKKIFVSVGYNDILHGTPADTIVANVKKIFDRASALSPTTGLFWINIISTSALDEAQNATLDQVNKALATNGELFKTIDANAALSAGIKNGTYSWDGGKYLNGAGYEAYAKLLAQYVGKDALNAAADKPGKEITDYYRHRVSMFRSLPNTDGKIVMLGNSLNNNAMWTELFAGMPIVNRGISGDVIPGIIDRLDEVVDENPHKVFLMTGANDLINNPDITVAEFWASYETLIKEIKSSLPHTFLYIQSVLPLNPKSKFYEGFNEKVVEINKLLDAGQSQYDYFYLDIAKALSDANGDLRDEYTSDGIHLTAEGYFIWASELLKGNRLRVLTIPISPIER